MLGSLFFGQTHEKVKKGEYILTQQEIRKKLKVIKVVNGIDNKFIADQLGMKNARSVANYLHEDYDLSDEKRRKAEDLIKTLWVEL